MKDSVFSVHFVNEANSEATFKIAGREVSSHHSAFLTPQGSENLSKLTRNLEHLHQHEAYADADPAEEMVSILRLGGIEAKRVGPTIIVFEKDWLSKVTR